jgi:hypothetical protein
VHRRQPRWLRPRRCRSSPRQLSRPGELHPRPGRNLPRGRPTTSGVNVPNLPNLPNLPNFRGTRTRARATHTRVCCKTRLGGPTLLDHERLACPRRPLGSHRTAVAEGAVKAQWRPPAGARPRRPRRHRLRPADRVPLAPAAERAGLRQRHYLLGANAGVWQEPGVWQRLHARLLDWLGGEAAFGWGRASVDSLSVRAKRGAKLPARIRPTVANQGRSSTRWSTGIVSSSPSSSPQPTPTAPHPSSRGSTPSPRSSGPGEGQVVRASVQ